MKITTFDWSVIQREIMLRYAINFDLFYQWSVGINSLFDKFAPIKWEIYWNFIEIIKLALNFILPWTQFKFDFNIKQNPSVALGLISVTRELSILSTKNFFFFDCVNYKRKRHFTKWVTNRGRISVVNLFLLSIAFRNGSNNISIWRFQSVWSNSDFFF